MYMPQFKKILVVECSQKQAGVTCGTQSPSCCPLGPRKWVPLSDLATLGLIRAPMGRHSWLPAEEDAVNGTRT